MEENARQQSQVDNFISFYLPEDNENPQSLEPQLVLNTYTLDYEKNLQIIQNILIEHPEWQSARIDKVKLFGKEVENAFFDDNFFKQKNPDFERLREEKREEMKIEEYEMNKDKSSDTQNKSQSAENEQTKEKEYISHTEFKSFEDYESVFMRKLEDIKSPKAQRAMLDEAFVLGENVFNTHFKPKEELEKLEKQVSPIKTLLKKAIFYDKASAKFSKAKDTIIKTKNNITESIKDRRNVKKLQEKELRESKAKIKSLNSEITANAGKLANPKDCEEFVKTLMAIIDAKTQKRALEKNGQALKEEIKEAYYGRKKAEKLASGLPYSYKELLEFTSTHFSDFKSVRQQSHKEHEFHQKITQAIDTKAPANKIDELLKQASKEAPNFAKTYPNTFKRANNIAQNKTQERTQSQYQGRSA